MANRLKVAQNQAGMHKILKDDAERDKAQMESKVHELEKRVEELKSLNEIVNTLDANDEKIKKVEREEEVNLDVP